MIAEYTSILLPLFTICGLLCLDPLFMGNAGKSIISAYNIRAPTISKLIGEMFLLTKRTVPNFIVIGEPLEPTWNRIADFCYEPLCDKGLLDIVIGLGCLLGTLYVCMVPIYMLELLCFGNLALSAIQNYGISAPTLQKIIYEGFGMVDAIVPNIPIVGEALAPTVGSIVDRCSEPMFSSVVLVILSICCICPPVLMLLIMLCEMNLLVISSIMNY